MTLYKNSTWHYTKIALLEHDIQAQCAMASYSLDIMSHNTMTPKSSILVGQCTLRSIATVIDTQAFMQRPVQPSYGRVKQNVDGWLFVWTGKKKILCITVSRT